MKTLLQGAAQGGTCCTFYLVLDSEQCSVQLGISGTEGTQTAQAIGADCLVKHFPRSVSEVLEVLAMAEGINAFKPRTDRAFLRFGLEHLSELGGQAFPCVYVSHKKGIFGKDIALFLVIAGFVSTPTWVGQRFSAARRVEEPAFLRTGNEMQPGRVYGGCCTGGGVGLH